MKSRFILSLAVVLYWMSSAQAANTNADVPAACKNLALMEAQLLQTGFDDGSMSGSAHNPSHLTLNTNNGLKIGKIEYLGGDGESDSEQGQLPCDKEQGLCTNPAGAGGNIDWARVDVMKDDYVAAQVVVSYGSRGGCTISSGKVP